MRGGMGIPRNGKPVPVAAPEAAQQAKAGPPTARTHQTEPWTPSPEGPRSLEDAIALAREHLARADEPDVEDIPDYVNLVVSDDVPDGVGACYLWIGEHQPDDRITWEDCVHDCTKKIPVRIHPSVLRSDEAIVAVIAHELFEIVHLRARFDERGGALTAREVHEHISYAFPGNLHYQAVTFGDRLVQAMRAK